MLPVESNIGDDPVIILIIRSDTNNEICYRSLRFRLVSEIHRKLFSPYSVTVSRCFAVKYLLSGIRKCQKRSEGFMTHDQHFYFNTFHHIQPSYTPSQRKSLLAMHARRAVSYLIYQTITEIIAKFAATDKCSILTIIIISNFH